MENLIQKEALYKLSYGVYVLTSRHAMKDNGCIINTAMLVSEKPYRCLVSVNKSNYTHEMIKQSGVLNISVLNDNTNFELIKRFGFQSGRDVNKFIGFDGWERSDNDVTYITENANAYISAKVIETVDVGTHSVFICDVTESVSLGDGGSLTYSDYHKNVKPKPGAEKSGNTGKTVYVCSICGYEHEGEDLPDDFVCPWCKHGADAFEKITK